MKAGQASATAKVIAAATVLQDGLPGGRGLVPPGAAALCRCFLSTSAADRLLRASAGRPSLRWAWRLIERLTHPGIVRHYALRKRWIESQCRSALAQGVRRVIVVGAGLDTLALRLAPSWPEVDWIELDHPATQAFKRGALSRCGLQAPPNLALHPVDLTVSPLPGSLMGDPRDTLVVIEGVLMYLDEAQVAALLGGQVRALSTAPVRLVFSHMVRWGDGGSGFRPSSAWVDRWLAWRAEPFKWAIADDALPVWLHGLGFEPLARREPPFADDADDADDADGSAGLKGENLVLCRSLPQGRDAGRGLSA